MIVWWHPRGFSLASGDVRQLRSCARSRVVRLQLDWKKKKKDSFSLIWKRDRVLLIRSDPEILRHGSGSSSVLCNRFYNIGPRYSTVDFNDFGPKIAQCKGQVLWARVSRFDFNHSLAGVPAALRWPERTALSKSIYTRHLYFLQHLKAKDFGFRMRECCLDFRMKLLCLLISPSKLIIRLSVLQLSCFEYNS